jgi:hypothetical protein
MYYDDGMGFGKCATKQISAVSLKEPEWHHERGKCFLPDSPKTNSASFHAVQSLAETIAIAAKTKT